MGAALTYARHYALFTLVGIAGEEDDVDAPDLGQAEVELRRPGYQPQSWACWFSKPAASLVARRLGWRPEFRWQRLAQWADRHGGVRVLERRTMPPFGHFSLIRFARLPAGSDGRARAGQQKLDGRQCA
jgi:ERF superfamily